MFYLAFTQLVQVQIPAGEWYEIVCHTFRQKNVPVIAAIHHSLRHVDTGPSDIGPLVNIDNLIDGPAMDPHPQTNLRMILNGSADLHCAFDRGFRLVKKHEQHSVPGGNANEFALGFGLLKSSGASHDPLKFAHNPTLLGDEQRRVLHHIHH